MAFVRALDLYLNNFFPGHSGNVLEEVALFVGERRPVNETQVGLAEILGSETFLGPPTPGCELPKLPGYLDGNLLKAGVPMDKHVP